MIAEPDKKEILDVLQHSAIFQGIDPDRIQEEFLPAMRIAHLKKYPREATFLTDDYFYIVVRGMVHGFLSDQHGERRISVFVLRKGDGFDVLSLLDEQDKKLVYSCLGREVICLQSPLSTVKKWILEEPDMAKGLLLYLAHLLTELQELIFDLSLCDTGTRLAKLLLKHAKNQPSWQ